MKITNEKRSETTAGRPVLLDELVDSIIDVAEGSLDPRQAAELILERFPNTSTIELVAAAIDLARLP
jgi:hypothetical protein